MTAITVRKISDGRLISFGPDNGQYDPGFDPVTTSKQREADYDAVLDEWQAMAKVPDARATAKTLLKNAKTLPDVLAALDQLL